jgi:pSer/pThr/pTyr-binding forkhead associated (FHA) protein
MSFHLVVAKGRHQGKTIPLKHSPFIIGRHKNCQLCAASMEISRQHCAIEVAGSGLKIKDLGSTNGTYVNNRKLDGEHTLHDNDLLQIGPLSLVVRLESAPVTADTQPGVIVTGDTQPGVDQPTPIPGLLGDGDEDSAATLLLQLDEVVPEPVKPEPAAEPHGKTMSAAQRILEKYRSKP